MKIKNFVKKNLSYINKKISPTKYRKLSSIINFVVHPTFRAGVINYFFNKKSVLREVEANTPLPRSLYFEGTNVCNADCVFCPYTRMKRPKTTMTMDFFKDIVDQYVSMGGVSIGFTPIVGDPLADKFLLDRIDYLDSIDNIKYISFYTNAIALKPEKIDKLVDFKNTTINLSISFGGHDQKTFHKIMGVDKFRLVKKHILYFLDVLEERAHDKLNIKFDFRFPDNSKNDSFAVRVKECIDKGLVRMDSVEGNFDTFGGLMTQEDLDRADLGLTMDYGYPKFGPCEIPFTKPLVLADGRLNACAERDLETDLTVGDLKVEKLRDLLYGSRMQEFVKSFYRSDSLPEVCKQCSVYSSIYFLKAKVWKKDLNWVDSKQDITLENKS
jgi:MoaA/NifB/PqqE/SkfB family radical SAM enzyme